MANKKISELTAAGALTGAELVELVQSGQNVQSTTQDIANLIPAGSGDVVGPASATDGAPVLFNGTTGKLIKNSTPTGTGNPVLATSPTLSNPVVGTQSPADNSQKAASTAYVDSAIIAATAGLKWKQPVRVSSTVAGTLATSFENGDTMDGVVLATGNRILLRHQADATENGIRVVAASGAPARAIDADTSVELEGAVVAVQEGTSNANTTWTQTTDDIILGTSNIVWAQFGTSVPDADASTKGILKLYPSTSLGTNTDGAPTQNAVKVYADAKVTDALVDGVTTVAPSQNAVVDALALKAPLASPTFTGIPAGPTAAPGTNTTQFATTAFVHSAQIFVNVKDYGAIGDGVTNDYTAIQNAINTGSAVFFPPGDYLVSTGLVGTNDDQQFIGYSGAFIKVTTNIDALTIQADDNIIEGINFIGNGTTGQKGLVMYLSERARVTKCGAFLLDYGFYFKPSAVSTVFGIDVPTPSTVTGCVANQNVSAGMYWEASAEYYDVVACNIYKNTGYGAWIKAGNVSITSSTINANNIGIYVDGIYNSGNTDHGTLVGNKINHNRQCGLWIKSTQYSQHVTGNDIWANIGDGTSGGNFASTGTSFGVYLQSADAINFTGNVIARNKVNLGYDGLTNSLIHGNTFITDSTRTTSHLKSFGFASEKFSINAQNLVNGNAFVGAYTGAVTKKFEPNTTAAKEQGIVTTNNVGTTQTDYVALTSGSTAFDLDGSQNIIYMTTGYSGTFTVRTGRTAQASTIYFNSISSATKAITFATTGSTTITSFTPGATVSSLTVTLNRTGAYHIVPLTGDNYGIFSDSEDYALTSGRVVLAGTNGKLGDDADLTFDGTQLKTAAFATGYVAKTALYTLTASDHTVEVTSGTHTQTLPTAVGITGRIYVITNSGSGTVTVGTTSSQTFVNVTATPTSLSLAQFKFVQVQSNGANWLVISQN